ncbi:hypothetical protein [Vibrio lentus]|uniref:hypothetical protein n=1 Tax=Vibrio lentus TaxID=136468 RepID=UPI000C85B435|nr:hypothetical protein [Vibrio lentus]PMJ58060.1 hypothetical protein BCU20_17090 [Vibrio lentus]
MKILYFDPHSILYSSNYFNSHDDVRERFENQKPFRSTDTLLSSVEPDRNSAQKLALAASEANLQLYPTDTCFTRELLLKHKVFSDLQLAPFVDLKWKVRLDDSDPIRRICAHASALDAEWFVCGDVSCDDRSKLYPNRFLVGKGSKAVSDELVLKIIATKFY